MSAVITYSHSSSLVILNNDFNFFPPGFEISSFSKTGFFKLSKFFKIYRYSIFLNFSGGYDSLIFSNCFLSSFFTFFPFSKASVERSNSKYEYLFFFLQSFFKIKINFLSNFSFDKSLSYSSANLSISFFSLSFCSSHSNINFEKHPYVKYCVPLEKASMISSVSSSLFFGRINIFLIPSILYWLIKRFINIFI